MRGAQGRNSEAELTAKQLLAEYDIPEVVFVALDVLILAGTPIEEIHSLASSKLAAMESWNLDEWNLMIATRVMRIYAGNCDENDMVRWAASEYPMLHRTYVHWALGMHALAQNDCETAKEHFENAVQQRVIYLGQYLWARSLLANWDELVASRRT